MIFGKEKAEWENLKGVFTATEIHQQPATWKKTIAQIKAQKDELKAFIANVVDNDDYDIILTGAGTSEFVGNALFYTGTGKSELTTVCLQHKFAY